MDEGKGLGAHPDLLGRCPEAATARAVKPDRFLPELWWKSYSFCHVDSLLEHPLCPISGCQRKRVNSNSTLPASHRNCTGTPPSFAEVRMNMSCLRSGRLSLECP